MKKVLFATTAIVAFAGAASADISISGYAELGITDAKPGTGADTSPVQFHQDVDVTFSMSGETDNGLAFGVSVDLDEGSNLTSTGNNGTAVFLSGAFGTLTVGNTNGALDQAMTTVTGPGSLTDNETQHMGFAGDYLDGSYDGQIARYDYTAGDLTVSVSAEIADVDVAGRSDGSAIGVKYTMGNIALGAGYQSADTSAAKFGGTPAAAATVTATTAGVASATGSGAVTVVAAVPAVFVDVDATGVSVSGTFGAVTAGVVLTSYDVTGTANDADHTHVGVSYTQGAMTIGANYGDFDSKTPANDQNGYGITANYSLGGGATLRAGYQSSEKNNVDQGSAFSLGISMAF